jgi:hypothetical protein
VHQRFYTTNSLESGRLNVVLATVFINIIGVALLTLAPWSDWKTGLALNIVDNFLLLIFIARNRDSLLPQFMVFGLAVGFTELAADAWLVDYTRTLDYSIGGGPILWRSPLWMPLAWEMVAVQFGYIGLRLWKRYRIWGLAGIGALGMINIPYYEEMAKHIHWWQYNGCRMISKTPYYIILGEFGIAMVLALLATQIRPGNWITALLLGIAGGAGIFVCYMLAYEVTDGFIQAFYQ